MYFCVFCFRSLVAQCWPIGWICIKFLLSIFLEIRVWFRGTCMENPHVLNEKLLEILNSYSFKELLCLLTSPSPAKEWSYTEKKCVKIVNINISFLQINSFSFLTNLFNNWLNFQHFSIIRFWFFPCLIRKD